MSDRVHTAFRKLLPGLAAGLLACVCNAADEFDGLVDPTAPINFSAPQVSIDAGEEAGSGFALSFFESYKLNSVLIRSNDRVAVVNGQRARVGDWVGSARVASISNDRVVLDINGETRVLELYGAPVKSLVAREEQ